MYVFLNQAGLTFYPESAEESATVGVVVGNVKVGLPPELQGGGQSGSVEPAQDCFVGKEELKASGVAIQAGN